MTGEYPFELITDYGQLNIENDVINLNEIMMHTMPNKLAELLSGMLNSNPEERLSMMDVCNAQWFSEMELLS